METAIFAGNFANNMFSALSEKRPSRGGIVGPKTPIYGQKSANDSSIVPGEKSPARIAASEITVPFPSLKRSRTKEKDQNKWELDKPHKDNALDWYVIPDVVRRILDYCDMRTRLNFSEASGVAHWLLFKPNQCFSPCKLVLNPKFFKQTKEYQREIIRQMNINLNMNGDSDFKRNVFIIENSAQFQDITLNIFKMGRDFKKKANQILNAFKGKTLTFKNFILKQTPNQILLDEVFKKNANNKKIKLKLYVINYCYIKSAVTEQKQEELVVEEKLALLSAEDCFYRAKMKSEYNNEWFENAADKGHSGAHYILGKKRQKGNDPILAFYHYTEAVENGSIPAMHALGEMHLNGEFVTQDDKKAFAWFQKAASQKHPESIHAKGRMYEQGRGVDQDLASAAQSYKEAHELGVPIATYDLGRMYEQGRGVDQDLASAAKLYKEAHEQKVSIATYNLGRLYEQGKGVVQNVIYAAKLYKKAADQESPEGLYALGRMHEEGKGVPQNTRLATHSFYEAAIRGLPEAQYAYALRCQEITEILYWMQLAADQGHLKALANL